MNSTKGYLNEIFVEQFLQRPLRIKKLRTGILSNDLMGFLHLGHADGGDMIDFLAGIL
jgi:hypothetical protein